MKLRIENEKELIGAIKAFISGYEEGVREVPADLFMEFKVTERPVAQNSTQDEVKAYRVLFEWSDDRKITDQDETNLIRTEDHRTNDWFTYLSSEPLDKLREYVEEVLEKVCATKIEE